MTDVRPIAETDLSLDEAEDKIKQMRQVREWKRSTQLPPNPSKILAEQSKLLGSDRKLLGFRIGLQLTMLERTMTQTSVGSERTSLGSSKSETETEQHCAIAIRFKHVKQGHASSIHIHECTILYIQYDN